MDPATEKDEKVTVSPLDLLRPNFAMIVPADWEQRCIASLLGDPIAVLPSRVPLEATKHKTA